MSWLVYYYSSRCNTSVSRSCLFFKLYTFRKVCFVSAKPIFNHIFFSFQVLTDCSAKNKHYITNLL